MASIWERFNNSVDLKGLQEDVANSGGFEKYPEIPKGTYEVELATLEQRLSKSSNNPMVSVSFRILTGKYKNQRIFDNKAIYGTKNDGRMIRSVVGFLNSLESEVCATFFDYDQFEQVLMDVHEAVDGKLVFSVKYDPEAFFKISVQEVFDR